MPDEDLLERLGRRIGVPVATTVVSEEGRDRRFIGEALLTAAALLLLKKYFDGVAEGLGVKRLGEEHAAFLIEAAEGAADLLRTQKALVLRTIEEYRDWLRHHGVSIGSKEHGEKLVAEHLIERGIPDNQA